MKLLYCTQIDWSYYLDLDKDIRKHILLQQNKKRQTFKKISNEGSLIATPSTLNGPEKKLQLDCVTKYFLEKKKFQN